MKKQIAVLCAVVATVVAVSCAKSPKEMCKESIDVFCGRTATCTDGGTTKEACLAFVDGGGCEAKTEETVCPDGGTYNSGNAQKCLDDTKAQTSCTATTQPASCSEICK